MTTIIVAAPARSRRAETGRSSPLGYFLRCAAGLAAVVGLFQLAGFLG